MARLITAMVLVLALTGLANAELLANPGPVVVGVTPHAGLYGAAYEFALNLDRALRKAGIRRQVEITFVTPEPYLGHFGHDGIGNSKRLLAGAFARQGSGYLALHPVLNPFSYDGVMLIHVLSGNLIFILIPFTKLAHLVLFPITQLVSETGWHLAPHSGREVAAALGKEHEAI